jgi:hypothetical protein
MHNEGKKDDKSVLVSYMTDKRGRKIDSALNDNTLTLDSINAEGLADADIVRDREKTRGNCKAEAIVSTEERDKNFMVMAKMNSECHTCASDDLLFWFLLGSSSRQFFLSEIGSDTIPCRFPRRGKE